MTEIYLHFLFAHYGLYGNAPQAQLLLHPGVCLHLPLALNLTVRQPPTVCFQIIGNLETMHD